MKMNGEKNTALLFRVNLRSGELGAHRLDTLGPGVVEQADVTLKGYGEVPGRPPFRVCAFTSMFTVFRGRELLVTGGVGKGRDSLWTVMVGLQELQSMVAMPNPPKDHLWLAVVEYPGLQNVAPRDREWLSRFECGLAAAILKLRA